MTQIKAAINTVTAFAPATVGNVVVGYDLLGCAVDTIGDQVTVSKNNQDGLVIKEIIGTDKLSYNINENVASFAISAFCKDRGIAPNFDVTLKKGIPLGSGMGGSAASSVAALVAINHFLEDPISKENLLPYAVAAEGLASGTPHADNVVPCLFGGMTLTRNTTPIDVIVLPVPDCFCVLVHPELTVKTKEARAVLPKEMPLSNVIKQSENLSSFIVALYEKRLDLLKTAFADVLIEPYRSQLVKGFDKVKTAAIAAGAFGASLSGSGPTMIALVENKAIGEQVKNAMIDAFKQSGVNSQGWVSPVSQQSASVLSVE